jgi:TatD DNase family protein
MLIDTHCHLDFPDFAEDISGVIARAKAAGVMRMVTISTRVARFPVYSALAEAHPEIWCTVGTHPHQAGEEDGMPAEEIIRLSAHPRCVAIGEAGLDYHYDKAPRDAQARGLRVHIAAARETGLPLVIHARQADEDMEAILREEMGKGAFSAILHCFSSGPRLAEAGVELGFYVSLSGILTFRASEELRQIARDLPLDRLLVETDAPYLAPMPHRGKRNEPAYVAETARVLAEVKGVSIDEIATITTANARRCYWKMDQASQDLGLQDAATG